MAIWLRCREEGHRPLPGEDPKGVCCDNDTTLKLIVFAAIKGAIAGKFDVVIEAECKEVMKELVQGQAPVRPQFDVEGFLRALKDEETM